MTVAALQATANGKDHLLLVLAADHLIRDVAQFRQTIDAGRKPGEEGRLVTFGIVPTALETGYGYIEKPTNPSPSGVLRMCRSSALWKSPIRPQRSSS